MTVNYILLWNEQVVRFGSVRSLLAFILIKFSYRKAISKWRLEAAEKKNRNKQINKAGN